MNRRGLLRIAVSLLSAAAVSPRLAHANTAQLIVRRIPSSGEEIPVIGLGTSGPFEIGESRTRSARRSPRCWRRSSAAGARLIDTSPMYSSAERVLGELLTASHARSTRFSPPRCGRAASAPASSR